MPDKIAYERKSEKLGTSEERREERNILSLVSQKRILTELGNQKKIGKLLHLQENESAYKPGRPEFNRMVGMIQRSEADTILVWKVNRIARNSVDGGIVIYLLDQGLLKEIITPNRTYRNTSDDKFSLSIEFAMSKKSSDDSSETIRENMMTVAVNGQYPNKAPVGYLNIDPEGRISGKLFDSHKQVLLEKQGRPLKRIEIDPIQGTMMKRLFTEYATGMYGLGDICKLANRIGLRSRKGNRLAKSTLSEILKNPFYTGAFWYCGKLYSDVIIHDPLISTGLYQKIQEVLQRKGFEKKEKNVYPFSGVITCGDCGSAISGQVQKGHRYYYCTRWKTRFSKIKCSHRKYYREEWMENEIGDYLLDLRFPPEMIECVLEALRHQEGEEFKTAEDRKKLQEKRLQETKQKRKNLIQLKISPLNQDGSLLSEEEFKEQKILLNEEISTLENQITKLTSQDLSWITNCVDFLQFSSVLVETFKKAHPSIQQGILKNIAEMELQDGKLTYKLREPYSFLLELKEALPENARTYEPAKIQSGSEKKAVLGKKCSVWWSVLNKIRTYFKDHFYIPPSIE